MRRPPDWIPAEDRLAQECGVQTVTFSRAVPPLTLCHYCGGFATTRDHIVPDSAGGSRQWWNLVPACVQYNTEKDVRQSCSCLFCLRAMALWSLGFRATGLSRYDKKRRRASQLKESA